ncbi:MAG: hypothetical protein OXE99_04295 [Cellvibrionales bacterium]|nr:hypothetical protein [Cellvibrionales bacterium]
MKRMKRLSGPVDTHLKQALITIVFAFGSMVFFKKNAAMGGIYQAQKSVDL